MDGKISARAFLAVPGVGMSAFPAIFLRHGATFAIGDYLDHLFSIKHIRDTNWASILFTQYLNDGMSIGEALLSAIAHTGHYYVTEWAVSTDGWIIYGDPTLEPYTPASPTAEPVPAAFEGISPEEPTPTPISDTVIYAIVTIIVIVIIIVAAYLLMKKK